MQNYDMLVIGSGPGGQRAAIQAAKLGKRVAIVEQQEIVGGVTAHTGTIPSKTLREAVLYLCGWREKGFYGRSYRVKADITAADLMQRLHTTIRQQIEIIRHQLTRNGVVLITGAASFVDPHTLRVVTEAGHEELFHAGHIVIATGTVPHRPADIPFDDVTIIDSDGILGIRDIPRTMTVIGAGVIGVEYATIFSALDTKITLIDGRNTILDFVDADIVDSFRHDLQDRGIALRLGEDVERVEKRADGRVITRMKSGRRVVSDLVMVAAGRMGATSGLALGNAGLSTGQPRPAGSGRVPAHRRSPTSTRSATSSAFRRSPPPQPSRAARRPATPSGSMQKARRISFPSASTPCRRSASSARPSSSCATRACPSRPAWHASARPPAARSRAAARDC